ncbi:hypothetical protein [Alicyclobacillus fastidiosus]|uniref:Uncharacterized protein n=1 Tax=Alicyclobacillus fastidiosus TaxID=392011 RepID=A0ABV5AHI0_9BACL|nr:hypothetical protein [Alicyclobacillus fastidiosus]WEH09193.1 hypothetical protein PYS47_21380 [Alicyclobacillus fastidiosus]
MVTSAGETASVASTVATSIASTSPGTGLFSSTDTAFPNWNLPDPSAYQWTLPNNSHWYNFAQNISSGVFSFGANTLLELIAWILHIAILVSSKFSDPSWITDPVVNRIAGVFKSGYNDVFLRFLPVLMMFVVGYLAWKYVVGHHAKMLTGIVSTLFATGLVTLFFFDFGSVFGWVNGAGNLITDTASAAVASTAGTSVGSEYDVLWDNYVLCVWEYGQFGQIADNFDDFNVNPSLLNNSQYEYQPDPTVQNPNPGEEPLPTTETINGVNYPTNWVRLYLDTTNSQGRSDLENILTTAKQPFSNAQMSDNAVLAANPFSMIPFLFIELLLLITPVVFLCYVGFQLFVRELLFIITILMGIVTVPMAFVPEIGWRITANWAREAVGHQVERLGNAVYAALLFSVAGIITVSIGSSEASMMLGFLVDSILFAAAMIYRQKVFSLAVHPMSDAVRGVDTHNRPMTVDEYIEQRHATEDGGKGRTLRGATIGKTGKLAEHFDHSVEREGHHHSVLPSSHRTADVNHHVLGSDEQPQFTIQHKQQPVNGNATHLADNFKENTNTTKRQKFVRNAKDLRTALGNAVQQHLNSLSNSEPPITHEERIRRRELRARGLEGKLHRHSVKALHRSVRALVSKPKMQDGFEHPNDPPDAPPGAGPADAATDYDKQRKAMVTPDGLKSQNVVTDKEGNEIAVETSLITRPRRDEDAGEINQPRMADSFNVPQVQDVSSVTEQPSRPISVTPPARVTEVEQAVQPTLATGFTVEPQPEPEPVPDQARLLAEKPLPQMDKNVVSTSPSEPATTENDTDGQVASQNAPQSNSEAVAPVSQRQSTPMQIRQLPPNVTRLQDEREHRQVVEGRQREQRSQRARQQQQGRRRVVRVNERTPRPPRPRGPEL